jgi:integrase
VGGKLTQFGIDKKCKPAAKRREFPDGENGLHLIVQPSGARSWAVRYRSPLTGKPGKHTIGDYATYPLAEARVEARAIAAKIDKGIDPAAEKKADRTRRQEATGNTFRAAMDDYFKREGDSLKSGAERRATLARHVLPILGDRPMESISRGDIVRLLDGIQDRSGKRAATLVLAYVGKLFGWYALRNERFINPIVRGMGRGETTKRDRVLDDTELVAFWRATEKWDHDFARMLRFVLLTATRRNEAAFIEWSEIEAGVWTIPAARYKTAIEHLVPLSEAAGHIIERMPRIVGSPHIFSARDFSKLKNRLDERMAAELGAPVARWTIHDLRRTARSLMARAGVSADHAERCLGHVIGGVRGVYDRHQYDAEKRQAFEALAVQVDRIVNPSPNVVPIRREV